MKKRILALLLGLVLCLGAVGTAFASGNWIIDEDGNIYQEPEVTPPPVTPTQRPSQPGGSTGSSGNAVGNNRGFADNGSWGADKTTANKGDVVTIVVTPDEGYKGVPTVKDANGKDVPVTKVNDTTYTFVMPDGQVKVDVEFTAIEDPKPTEPVEPENPFTDVYASDYYYDAVLWAVDKGVTNGTNTEGTRFSPNDPCTRAQIVTFLWRAYGKPEPAAAEHKFTDVEAGAYYYDAMLWAVENGITNGTNAEGTRFSPNDPCTRAQAVTFQYRAAKATPVPGSNSFTDVAAADYFANAVQWAVKNGITNGTNTEGTRFSPDNVCTRGQIVTFLYRELGNQ